MEVGMFGPADKQRKRRKREKMEGEFHFQCIRNCLVKMPPYFHLNPLNLCFKLEMHR